MPLSRSSGRRSCSWAGGRADRSRRGTVRRRTPRAGPDDNNALRNYWFSLSEVPGRSSLRRRWSATAPRSGSEPTSASPPSGSRRGRRPPIADALKAMTGGKVPTFATLGDWSVFYILLNQDPPYHINFYDASQIAEQQHMLSALKKEDPSCSSGTTVFGVDGPALLGPRPVDLHLGRRRTTPTWPTPAERVHPSQAPRRANRSTTTGGARTSPVRWTSATSRAMSNGAAAPTAPRVRAACPTRSCADSRRRRARSCHHGQWVGRRYPVSLCGR